METELMFCSMHSNPGESSEDDSSLEDKTASNTTEDHTSLGKPGHEVEETRPATEDGDEDNDECCDSSHVLYLCSTSWSSIRYMGLGNLWIVLQ